VLTRVGTIYKKTFLQEDNLTFKKALPQNLALQELYRFTVPLVTVKMLVVQRKTINIPKQTTNKLEQTQYNEH